MNLTKKQIKTLKFLAKQFPKSLIEIETAIEKKGRHIDVEKVDSVDGKTNAKIRKNRTYIGERTIKLKPLNHYKELKRFLNKYGWDTFLDKYQKWFVAHHKYITIKYVKEKTEENDSSTISA